MPRLIILTCLFIIGVSHSSRCQETILMPKQELPYIIKGDYQVLRVDDFGNIYLLENDNTLKKFNASFQLLFEYSFIRLGTVTDLEVNNPTKLMVFFADYQIILFLDNTLSEINRLNLEDLGFWNITSVTQSPDNKLWLYDPVNFKIVKIDATGKVLYSSNEFYFGQITQDIQPRLNANLNYTICYTDSEYTIFTNFGELYRSADKPIQKASLKKDYILFLSENIIEAEAIVPDFMNPPRQLFTQDNKIRDFFLSNTNTLFILDEKGVKKLLIN